ncbi:hypothetical protein [Gemmatimonas sp.]|uniref:hypothetical protein n=1 Tax=Gemmatimonas sp. TaxID=1962908 RepID=UPI0025B92198|nr:hypothetical protein [Gemmatimonas sp.]MCA2984579.1 hypothetical protein [Gemmatimonas sp.]MCA2985973.1 hypothetical protein [Gemmatimonas sp.]MCA2996506.1 hypothetical protein [Gemmatimonas sp.]
MPAQAPSRPLRLPVLLDQQFWFLGHDIRHTDGNALQRFGFVRWGCTGSSGTSCYVYGLTEQAPLEAIVCWGFAAYCGPVQFANATPATTCPPGGDVSPGVLLQRHSRSPRVTEVPLALPLHRLSDLPRSGPARTDAQRHAVRRQIVRMAELFSRYERWARGALGDRYRLRTLSQLPRHKQRCFEPVPDLSEQWARLAL